MADLYNRFQNVCFQTLLSQDYALVLVQQQFRGNTNIEGHCEGQKRAS
jgi:hypothetical protein